jgi:Flp pilus assembly pilin Flp
MRLGRDSAPTDGAGAVHYTLIQGQNTVRRKFPAVLVSLYAIVTGAPVLDTQLSRRFRRRIPAVSL